MSITEPLYRNVDHMLASLERNRYRRERDEAVGEQLDAVGRDLDETRRLLYMALAARRTTKYNLVGTLVNALVHHSGLVTDVEEALTTLVEAVERGGNAELWVLARLDEVNALIEAAE